MTSAAEVRHDAVVRLIELAGDERYDPDLIAGRRTSLEMLRRRILDRRRGDLAVLAELDRIWPLATGDSVALIDTVRAGGPAPAAPDATAGPPATLADLEQALADWSAP
jgi:hypothetical protein